MRLSNYIGALAGALLFGVGLPAIGAPSASFNPHRTSGRAPLFVHFDATATTSSVAGDRPFYDLLYQWNFGDPNAGSWSTNGKPKNTDDSGTQGHVFYEPGTYVVNLVVTDRNGEQASTARTITVSAWATSETACISASGNFSGCVNLTAAARITSSSFGAAITQATSAGYRRILFRKGETFNQAGAYSGPTTTGVLVSSFGTAGDAKPRIVGSGTGNVSMIGVRGNDWRIQGLDMDASGSTLHGIATDAEVNDFSILQNDIIVATDKDDIFAPTNGPPFVSDRIAIADNHLRGNLNPVTLGSSSGACYYGGSIQGFFAGNRCGKSSAWQIRTIFNDRSIFSHNLVEENGGAFEGVKFHCAGNETVHCRFNTTQDNVVLKERFNVTAGRGEDGNRITDSVFARNYVPTSGIIMEQPDNLYKNNIVQRFRISVRAFNSTFTRDNRFVNNTCYDPSGVTSACVVTLPGSDALGTFVANNVFWANQTANPVMVTGTGANTSSVVQQNNAVVSGVSPFVSATIAPFPFNPTQYQLKAGSPHINAGTLIHAPSIDLLGHARPQGPIDLGALEVEELADLTPPGPAVVTGVTIIP